LDNKSRMKGDLQVRFCEKLGVKFPGFTRLPGAVATCLKYIVKI
jgi:hypothetical protein